MEHPWADASTQRWHESVGPGLYASAGSAGLLPLLAVLAQQRWLKLAP